MIQPQLVSKLLLLFKTATKHSFQHILPFYQKAFSISEKLAAVFATKDEFIKEIVDRLGLRSQAPSFVESNSADTSSQSLNLTFQNQYIAGRTECTNPAMVVQIGLLTILLRLCEKSSSPRKLMNENNLYSIVFSILHIAQKEDIVLLEELATQIISLYSTSEL